jgi:hypothetical protein
MNDRSIENLLKMAGEIERLESGELNAPIFRIARAPRAAAMRLVRVGALSACAAGLLLAGVLSLQALAPTPSPVQPGPGYGSRIAQAPEQQPTLVAADDDRQCMVLTVFRDGKDECDCVQWQTPDLADRSVEDLGRSELLQMALQAPCTTSAQKIVVLAVSAPSARLPRTREDAERLAAHLSRPGGTHAETSALAYAALGPEATIISETVAFKRPTLPTPGDLLNR